MTSEHGPNHNEQGLTKAYQEEQERRNKAFLLACYRFSAALTTLRTAITAADDAPGTIFSLEGECTPEKTRDLHARWAAASCVLHEGIDAIVEQGGALLNAMQAVIRL